MPEIPVTSSRAWLHHHLPKRNQYGSDPLVERQKSEHAILSTERSNGRHQQNLYELFSEMEEKDGHLYSLIQTRINALLGLSYDVWQPSSDQDENSEVTDFVRRSLNQFPRFREFLKALLDSLSKGFSAVELIWDYDSDGRLVVVDWTAHPQEYFFFSEKGELHLLQPPFEGQSPSPGEQVPDHELRSVLPGSKTVRPPEHKFVTHHFGRDARNPFGRGLCQRAYWYYWFKKNTLRSWSLFNEKYGAPLAVAKVDSGVSEEDRQALLEVLNSIQTDAGVVLPDSIRLEFLEAAQRGDGDSFRNLADWCNDEMSRIILGATLTTGEGRRSGSMALGEVHNEVRRDYLESDACQLASLLNETIIPWLVELNFRDSVPPVFNFDVSEPEDLEKQLQIDSELVRLGVPLSISQLYERYGRRIPAKGERSLAYDDSNLFQYHLRFGILTINEVRARLHLPSVPWGDQPTSGSIVPDSGLGSLEERRGDTGGGSEALSDADGSDSEQESEREADER